MLVILTIVVLSTQIQKGDFVEKLAKLILSCCAFFLLASCSANLGSDKGHVQAPLKPLSCIAVLPAGTSVDRQASTLYEETGALERGADFITEIMARELQGNPKVRLLTASQVATLAPEISGGVTGMVATIGNKVNCDAVLLTKVRRFKQREGTEYAVDEPASADFEMALLHSGTGAVLWTADYRETQESLLENILTYNKAEKRGFKWVTVEQLVDQAVKDRLASCPYL